MAAPKDNKTYKDMYHFTDAFYSPKTKKDLPSLNMDDTINSTIKENPDKSNVEIEGDEVVLQPDMSALFKARGKKHSSGGMDVYLKPDSFVFSNDKSLAITEHENELFEFKKGGDFDPKNSTPAKILKKNIDVKHYNTIVNNITDVKKDDLAKKSSALMLQKYISTLGNIAYLQEKKKDFPQGLPSFSEGTAPVYDAQVKQNVDAQKQYAKYGGRIRYAQGGPIDIDDDQCPCKRNPVTGICNPCTPDVYEALLKEKARKVGQPLPGFDKVYENDNATMYAKFGKDAATRNFSVPGAVPGGIAGEAWKKRIQTMIDQGASLDQLVAQKHGTKEGLQRMFKFPVNTPGTPDDYIYTPKQGPPNPYSLPNFGGYGSPPEEDIPTPNSVDGNAQGEKTADWQFSPWQKISQLYNWGQYAAAKRYMPIRSHYNASYVDPSLVNPEQAIGDLKGAANAQTASLNTLSPVLRNAQAQSIYGQELDRAPGIRSQYDNQNAQITNQFRQYNNQTRNQESQTNINLDQDYYRASIEGRKNFDNLKSHLANNAMNNVMRDVETNQKLAYNLLTRNNPAYGYDWRTGNFYRNKKDIRDSQSVLPQDSFEAMIGQAKKLKDSGLPDSVISSILRGQFFKQAAPYFQQPPVPPPFKKGGKFRGNNSKY